MPPFSESALRDRLAARLDLIEPGLELLDVEYVISSKLGAGGRIDILARDRLGIFVVIELKKSDKTAREAIQELQKYAGLLKIERGLGNDRLRCIVVSTHWHELLIPFSEFAAAASYPVEGVHLIVDDAGLPIQADRVLPLVETSALVFCPIQYVLNFSTAEGRDKAIETILSSSKNESIAIVNLDYTGVSDAVIYPYATYITAVHRGECPLDDEGSVEESHDPAGATLDAASSSADEVAAAHPEKFRSIQPEWAPVSIRRSGVLTDKTLYRDEEILIQVSGLQGGNPNIFQRIATPRFDANWNAMLKRLLYSLQGNAAWSEGALSFLEDARRTSPRATVGVSVFNPQNFLMSVREWIRTDEATFLPHLQIVCDDSDAVRWLEGRIVWDGVTRIEDPMDIFARLFGGDPFQWALHGHMGGLWAVDDQLVREYGLRYHLVETTYQKGSEPFIRPYDAGPAFSLDAWLRTNREQVDELAKRIDSIHFTHR